MLCVFLLLLLLVSVVTRTSSPPPTLAKMLPGSWFFCNSVARVNANTFTPTTPARPRHDCPPPPLLEDTTLVVVNTPKPKVLGVMP